MSRDKLIKKICSDLGIETPTLEQYQKVVKTIESGDDFDLFFNICCYILGVVSTFILLHLNDLLK